MEVSIFISYQGFPDGSAAKNLPAVQETQEIPGSERSRGGGNGNLLQYSLSKNTGVDCHALLQGIFPTQGLNFHLLCLLLW